MSRLRLRDRLPIGLVLVGFVFVATFYNVANPLFEAPDEIWHYLFAQRLRATGQLPIQAANRSHAELLSQQEAAQPPLYYAIGAAITFWIPAKPTMDWLRSNEHGSIGSPRSEDNKNIFVHSAAEDFPYKGDYLAAHLLRLLSTLFGVGTVLVTYLIARELLPSRKELAIGAAGINAFIPQFVYMSAAVNNDVPAAFFSSATLYCAIRVAKQQAISRNQALVLGFLGGLAILTKFAGLVTIPLIAVACVLPALRSGRKMPAIAALVAAMSAVTVTVSWWFARNLLLYGDLLPLKAFLGRESLHDQIPSVAEVVRDLDGLRLSFWGLFGWFSILVDPRAYAVFDLLSVAATVGLLVRLLKKGEGLISRSARLLVLLWLAAVVLSLLQYRLIVQAFQGRLLFPAISALAVLIALGLTELAPRFAGKITAIVIVLMAGISVSLVFTSVLPFYSRIPALASLPEDPSLHLMNARFEPSIALVGYKISGATNHPGDTVEVTLYWSALQRVAEDYSVFVQLLDASNEVVAQKDTFPGGGRNATSLWKAGDLYADEYRLTVPAVMAAPTALRLHAGLYLKRTMQRLAWVDGAATGDVVDLQRIRVVPRNTEPNIQYSADVEFSGVVRLAGYSLNRRSLASGAELAGNLVFIARALLQYDYTIFVQLLGPDGIVAQDDEQPRGGAFPTSAWLPGDVVPHPFVIRIHGSVPPGEYSLITGLYDWRTGKRLGVGQRDFVDLGTVAISAPD